MSNYYANVDRSYPDDAGHDGSLGNEFSYAELNGHSYSNPSENTYWIIGTGIWAVGCGIQLNVMGNTWRSYDPPTNGPAIFVCDADVQTVHKTGGVLQDILIYADDGIILTGIAKDCLFNPVSQSTWVASQDAGQTAFQLYGCSFYNKVLNTQGIVHCQIDFYDCAIGHIDVNIIPMWRDNWYGHKCALSDAFPDAIGLYTGCQTGWPMPACPVYTVSRMSFAASILTAGITTPPQPGTTPYTSYETGLWGEPRTGIGAVVFSQIYYADLDLTGTGGTGTELDPWHAETFKIQVHGVLDAGSIVKTKGTCEIDLVICGYSGSSITIENWIDDPWKFNNGFVLEDWSILKNGIINSSGNLNVNAGSLYDCYIKTYSLTNGGSAFKGCTIISESYIGGDCVSIQADFIDCIIDCQNITKFDAASSDNCCWTIDEIPGIGVHTHAQTGWTPPSWPAWDATQSAFSENLLCVGINTPPEPGNSPYTDYEKGLWDSTRTGIGAVWFVIHYTVTYNGNGNTSGIVPVDGGSYSDGDPVTVLNNTGVLVKTGYFFTGWNTNPLGRGTHYNGGNTFPIHGNMALYAQWWQVGEVEYWVAQSDSTNWNNTINWSTSSGGYGGAPVPNNSTSVIFDRSGSGQCFIDADAKVTNATLAGYRGSFLGDWTTTNLYLNSGNASAANSDSSLYVLGDVHGSSSFGSWSPNNNLPIVFDGTVTQYLYNESDCIFPSIVVSK